MCGRDEVDASTDAYADTCADGTEFGGTTVGPSNDAGGLLQHQEYLNDFYSGLREPYKTPQLWNEPPRECTNLSDGSHGSPRRSVDKFYNINKISVRLRSARSAASEGGSLREKYHSRPECRHADVDRSRLFPGEYPPPYHLASMSQPDLVHVAYMSTSGDGSTSDEGAQSANEDTSHAALHVDRAASPDQTESIQEQKVDEVWRELREREKKLKEEQERLKAERRRLQQERSDTFRQRMELREERRQLQEEQLKTQRARNKPRPQSWAFCGSDLDGTDYGGDDDFRSSFDSVPSESFSWTKYRSGAFPTSQPDMQSSQEQTSSSSPLSPLSEAWGTYNTLWSNLAKDDSNVPYPTPGHTAAELVERTHLPFITYAWSDDSVMKYNACAFLLSAHGVRTTCSRSSEKIQMLDVDEVSTEKLGGMISSIRIQLRRWHSDSLQYRNGGSEGINEELMNDPKAKAVFIGLRELRDELQRIVREREGRARR